MSDSGALIIVVVRHNEPRSNTYILGDFAEVVARKMLRSINTIGAENKIINRLWPEGSLSLF